jgi:hypothetical protein
MVLLAKEEGFSPFPLGQKETNWDLVQNIKACPKVPEVFAHRDWLQSCLQIPEIQGKWRERQRAGNPYAESCPWPEQMGWEEPLVPAAGRSGSRQRQTLH